jgi:ATP-dependent RNA helicase DDX31/DBP7
VVSTSDDVYDDDHYVTMDNTTSKSTTTPVTNWMELQLHSRLVSAVHTVLMLPMGGGGGPVVRAAGIEGSTPSTSISRPTPIQCQAIPLLLLLQPQNGPKNMFLHSETGSGKTFAYLLPILQSMMLSSSPVVVQNSNTHQDTTTTTTTIGSHTTTTSAATTSIRTGVDTPVLNTTVSSSSSSSSLRVQYGTKCIILCPTRELAVQTTRSCEQLCRVAGMMHIVPGCLGGGSSRSSSSKKNINKNNMNSNKDHTTTDTRSAEKVRLRKGLGIVIATPGRLLDHLSRTESLRTAVRSLQWLVLDEIDRLLDHGLAPQVQQIVQILLDLVKPCASMSPSSLSQQQTKHISTIPWRSVMVSATMTDQVQDLAKEMLLHKGSDSYSKATLSSSSSSSWMVVNGSTKAGHLGAGGCDLPIFQSNQPRNTIGTTISPPQNTVPLSSPSLSSLANASPHQLIQLHVTCSAKLRLTALISFLLERMVRGETTVVFVSTCAAVDYYYELLAAMDCIVPSSDRNESSSIPSKVASTTSSSSSPSQGIFGQYCPIFRIHGNVPHHERQVVLQKFKQAAVDIHHGLDDKKQGSSVLFATDVAARGLNLPSVDWIVQYDVPCDVTDYVHRAGRVARAGGAGHALLFLLPSEKDFLSVLQQRGISTMSPMSLALMLNTAAGFCTTMTNRGIVRSGGTTVNIDQKKDTNRNNSRLGEAFCMELQNLLEECVIRDELNAKVIAKQKKEKQSRTGPHEMVTGRLMELARNAFLSYVRAYPTKEKMIRHIFAAKALHLGHVARSFALKEPPKQVGMAAAKSQSLRKRTSLDYSEDTTPRKKQALSFDRDQRLTPSKKVSLRQKKTATTATTRSGERSEKTSMHPGKARLLLMTNAARLQNYGLDAL